MTHEQRSADRAGRNLSPGTCPECGKHCYPTRAEAKRAARQKAQRRKTNAYRCGDFWHLTSQDYATKVWHREHRG
ncbi:MAG TPA: hypothetical protein VNO54_06580 [Streptosporangiaceae bacterium]|nr:hypothetical protein [Streptosporangiaceae bacterium]